MTKTAEKEFKPLFPGTDSKSTIREQRKFCLSELGAGAKKLSEVESEIKKVTEKYKEVSGVFDKIKENYDALREAPVVKLEEYQYIQIQHRDFTNKRNELESQMKGLEIAADAIRKECEKMRKNVIYLEEKLSQEAKVIDFDKRRGVEKQGCQRA